MSSIGGRSGSFVAPGGLVELGYSERTSNLSVAHNGGSGTTGPSDITIVSDGSPVLIEFFCGQTIITGGQQISASLYLDGVETHRQWYVIFGQDSATVYPCYDGFTASYRHTFSPGSHTIGARFWGNGTMLAAGTNNAPMFLRVSKIVEQGTALKPFWTPPIVTELPTNATLGDMVTLASANGNHRPAQYDGTDWQIMGAGSKPPMCKASGTTSVPASNDTTCSFSTEVLDTDGIFAPTSTDFTIQTAGVYLFTAELLISGQSDTRGDVYIQKNGAGWLARTTLHGTVERFPVTVVDDASANDVYTVRVYQSNSTSASKNCVVTFTALWQGQA